MNTPSMRLGRWTLPRGQVMLVSIYLIRTNEAVFPNARSFDPDRFAGSRPDTYQWIPSGGGLRRCVGAADIVIDVGRCGKECTRPGIVGSSRAGR